MIAPRHCLPDRFGHGTLVGLPRLGAGKSAARSGAGIRARADQPAEKARPQEAKETYADVCSLTVGSVTAAPGQLASGWIDVPDGVDSGTRVPVTVANGAAAGPVLALVAGTHGSEYTSILALQRLPAPTRACADAGRRDPGPHGKPAGVLRPPRLPRPRREEPEPRLSRPGRRHGERANRPRAHARGDRSVHPPRRHALRGRQRVPPALQLLDRDRRQRARLPSPATSPSPMASTTSSWTADGPGTRRPACSWRTPRSPGASPRSRPSRGAWDSRTSPRSPPTRPARARSSRTSASSTARPCAIAHPVWIDRVRGPPVSGDRASGSPPWRRCSRSRREPFSAA